MSYAILIVILLTACPLALAAEDTSELRQELSATFERIKAITSDRTCFDSSQCASLAIGQKACGGPARIITYSTQLGHESVIELLNLANRSTILQRGINEADFAISTCGMTLPGPLMCSEGHCIELSKSFGEENVKLAGTFLASIIYTTKLSALSENLSRREISQEARQRIIFRSALRISGCVLTELTSDPESKGAPLVDALASPYDDRDIGERLETIYDEVIADEQLRILRPILNQCVETEEMSVLSTYPRR